MFILKIKLPPIVDNVVGGLGNLTTNLSMVFIGMALATVEIKSVLKKWWVFIFIPIKMIILPIIFICIFKFVGIKEILVGAVVLEAAMPFPVALTIVANEYKADYEYAAVGMFVTTLASLVTLPFVCYMLQTLM